MKDKWIAARSCNAWLSERQEFTFLKCVTGCVNSEYGLAFLGQCWVHFKSGRYTI